MVIVSQSKRMILNFNNILRLGISSLEDKSIAIKMYEPNERAGTIIAQYEAEGRAKEVLQEIINTYKFNRSEAVTQKNAVYEMPEK